MLTQILDRAAFIVLDILHGSFTNLATRNRTICTSQPTTVPAFLLFTVLTGRIIRNKIILTFDSKSFLRLKLSRHANIKLGNEIYFKEILNFTKMFQSGNKGGWGFEQKLVLRIL